MDYDTFCKKCKNFKFTAKDGIICKLTKEKPLFETVCDDFKSDERLTFKQTREKIRDDYNANKQVREKIRDANKKALEKIRDDYKTKSKKPTLKDALKAWGIALIVLGVIHILSAGFLDPIWGVFIIILGVLNLMIPKRGMFIANGIMLIFVGLLNLAGTLSSGGSGWAVFGALQTYWGIKELLKYKLYAPDIEQL